MGGCPPAHRGRSPSPLTAHCHCPTAPMLNTRPDGIDNLALVGGALCLDFVNTQHNVERPDAPDELLSFDHWIVWAERSGAISSGLAARLAARAADEPRRAQGALDEVKRIRELVNRAFSAVAEGREPAGEYLEGLREAWTASVQAGYLSREGDHFTWAWDETTDDLSQPLWPVVGSAISLLQSPELSRVRLCGGHDCSWLFLDRSKNGRRRWCQMDVCGNRAKARRHYHRKQRTKNG